MDKEKINFVAPILAVLFLAGNLSFAQQESGGAALPAGKGYTYNLQELIKRTNENIKKVDKELEKQALEERNMKKEGLAREHFEKGDTLYKKGKLLEAQREWRKALDITKSSDMQEHIKLSEKEAREKELLNRKEEKERQARVKAEQTRIDKENKDKERQAKLEAEKREKARLQAEEKASKAKEAAEKEAQKQLIAEKKEHERRVKAEQARIDKENKAKEEKEKQKQPEQKNKTKEGKQKSDKNFNWQ